MLLHKEIQRLKQQLLFLGALIEERVNLAVKSVDQRDQALAQRVMMEMPKLIRWKLIWKRVFEGPRPAPTGRH